MRLELWSSPRHNFNINWELMESWFWVTEKEILFMEFHLITSQKVVTRQDETKSNGAQQSVRAGDA